MPSNEVHFNTYDSNTCVIARIFENMVINNLEYKFNLKNRKFEIKLKSNLFIELRKNTVKNLTHASVH